MSNSKGRFGVHGGQYIPETLMNAVIELEQAYEHYKNDPEFNRELSDLLNNYAGRLRTLVPGGVLFVSESGVKSREDVAKIEQSGADAVLVGEALMRAENISRKLAELKGEI